MDAFDPAAALRLIAVHNIRTAQGWGELRDLHGALAVTSDAPIAALNSLGGFMTTDSEIDQLLDIGFALLRAFDRPPCVELTPLDRPESIARRLEDRGLELSSRSGWMTLRDGPPPAVANTDLRIRVAGGDDVTTFSQLHGGSDPTMRRLSRATTFAALVDPGNTFYLGSIEGQPVATLHVIVDGTAAAIFAVGVARAQRKRGIASAMIARAISDARHAGCTLIGLSTDAGGDAERLYTRLGFTRAFESQLWLEPDHPLIPNPIKRKKPRTR